MFLSIIVGKQSIREGGTKKRGTFSYAIAVKADIDFRYVQQAISMSNTFTLLASRNRQTSQIAFPNHDSAQEALLLNFPVLH